MLAAVGSKHCMINSGMPQVLLTSCLPCATHSSDRRKILKCILIVATDPSVSWLMTHIANNNMVEHGILTNNSETLAVDTEKM